MAEDPSPCRSASATRYLTPLLLSVGLGFTAAPALAVPVPFTGFQSNDTPPPTPSLDPIFPLVPRASRCCTAVSSLSCAAR